MFDLLTLICMRVSKSNIKVNNTSNIIVLCHIVITLHIVLSYVVSTITSLDRWVDSMYYMTGTIILHWVYVIIKIQLLT